MKNIIDGKKNTNINSKEFCMATKKKHYIAMKLFFLFLLFGLNSIAQNTNHTTVKNLEVFYRDSDNLNLDTIKLVKVNAIVTLNNSSDISQISYKIINGSNVIYQVEYLINTSPIINAEGQLLFKKEGDMVFINTPNEIPLNGYTIEITTKNALGEISETYSDLK